MVAVVESLAVNLNLRLFQDLTYNDPAELALICATKQMSNNKL